MLRVASLTVSYGRRPVFRDLDLEVHPGEFMALVGPNGCGKSTLIKAVSRVIPWASGEVYVGEAPLSRLSARDVARKVAVVPQNPVLPSGYSAGDVVLMGRTAHLGLLAQESGHDIEVARSSLARVGASDLQDRPVDELSGGERQNVVLARALAQEAPVLLLDEPTANLDIGRQIAVAGLLRELATSSLAVLAAIHDLTLASLHADCVALMDQGRVVDVGPPESVLTAAAVERVYGARIATVTDRLARPLLLPLAADDPHGTSA